MTADLPTPGADTFEDVMKRRLSRRNLLKSTVAATTVVIAGSAVNGVASAAPAVAPVAAPRLNFTPIAPSASDSMIVAEGHTADVVLRWGDPIFAGAPEFDLANQTAAAQEQQFGYNCDFVGFFPLPQGSNATDHGLLVVNHEYTNPEIMFDGYDEENPTKEQVDIELAAHGLSVVEIKRDGNGKWQVVRDSSYNRRITANTEFGVSGAMAGSEWLRTNADPTGTAILGTLNNCAAGKTPWGTVMSAEENFNQYFANANSVENEVVKNLHLAFGVPTVQSGRKWERFYDRFDTLKEPKEPFRHGWVVEIDPYDPTWKPIKRTNLGRFKHEAATSTVAKGGQVVFYSGDDERFQRVYKYVTKGSYNASDRTANRNLMDEGVLYVATFNDDGKGTWTPLVYGQNGLDESNGFVNQTDILINTRRASDVLGATRMDRPEDIEVNEVNKKVYIALTNNTNRTAEQVDAANPRASNTFGHIIELTETDDDHAATTFEWNIFLLAGDPNDESTYFAGYDKSKVSIISCPDNVTFDMDGNLWISTDGQPGTIDFNDGLFSVPVAGADRGFVRQFFSGIPGGEVCGPEFTSDNTTLFAAIQHPGEGGTVAEPVSLWPDQQGAPRPSVIAITATNGGRVGTTTSGPATTTTTPPTTEGQMPQTMPATGAEGSMLGGLMSAAGAAAVAAGALLGFRARRMQENAEQSEQEESSNE
jgi:secreted PhoX family phosphatase